MGSNPLIISAALTGAITTQAEAPALPVTPQEIADDVVACARAGAAIVHIHVQNDQGEGTMDLEAFTKTYEAVQAAIRREGIDVILNLTTSGSGTATEEERLAHLERLRPEMCSFDAGSLNWAGDIVFLNPPAFLRRLGDTTVALGIKPEIEVFDTTMIKNAVRCAKQGNLAQPLHFQFVLGTYGGMAATVENLVFLRGQLPPDATYSVSGIGAGSVPMLMAALAMGADGIRVGLEDNVYMSKGVPATNVLQVERAVTLAHLAGREIATAQQARELLHIAPRG